MEEARIFYLNWDKERRTEEDPELGPASQLFHDYGVEHILDEDERPPEEFTEEEFQELYREIATVEGEYDNPEQLWEEWNAGSRKESQEFYDAEVRSMSVGDVVKLDDTYYQAKAIGFDEITVHGGDER